MIWPSTTHWRTISRSCDSYHCSVLGPTHPNRLMQMSGTIDPGGGHGGPITDTNFNPDLKLDVHVDDDA